MEELFDSKESKDKYNYCPVCHWYLLGGGWPLYEMVVVLCYLLPVELERTKMMSVSGITLWMKTCSSSRSPKGPWRQKQVTTTATTILLQTKDLPYRWSWLGRRESVHPPVTALWMKQWGWSLAGWRFDLWTLSPSRTAHDFQHKLANLKINNTKHNKLPVKRDYKRLVIGVGQWWQDIN